MSPKSLFGAPLGLIVYNPTKDVYGRAVVISTYRESFVINFYSASGHNLQSGPVNYFLEEIINMALIATPSPSLRMDAKCSTKAVCTTLAGLASNLYEYPLMYSLPA